MAGSIAAVAGGGGSDDSGTSANNSNQSAFIPPSNLSSTDDPNNATEQSFKTSEFLANPTLDTINAEAAYAQNAFGNGVKVAVIDTGINRIHLDLAGRVSDFTYNINGDQDSGFHGTEIAGVLAATRNSSRMHGVAPQADILSIQSDIENVNNPQNTIKEALQAAIDKRANIVNNSWSFGKNYQPKNNSQFDFIDYLIPTFDNALALSENERPIFVWSAGNRGLSQPSVISALPEQETNYEPYWLSVVAVDTNNNIASFSNRCGDTADYCLSAPGTNFLTTTGSGTNGHSFTNGTSVSAPVVSGAIALLKSAFPNLTPSQIVKIILNSATDLGEVGIDNIYGNGLLNIREALSSSGATTLSASGGSINLGTYIPD